VAALSRASRAADLRQRELLCRRVQVIGRPRGPPPQRRSRPGPLRARTEWRGSGGAKSQRAVVCAGRSRSRVASGLSRPGETVRASSGEWGARFAVLAALGRRVGKDQPAGTVAGRGRPQPPPSRYTVLRTYGLGSVNSDVCGFRYGSFLAPASHVPDRFQTSSPRGVPVATVRKWASSVRRGWRLTRTAPGSSARARARQTPARAPAPRPERAPGGRWRRRSRIARSGSHVARVPSSDGATFTGRRDVLPCLRPGSGGTWSGVAAWTIMAATTRRAASYSRPPVLLPRATVVGLPTKERVELLLHGALDGQLRPAA
jgi:hypothetical protein